MHVLRLKQITLAHQVKHRLSKFITVIYVFAFLGLLYNYQEIICCFKSGSILTLRPRRYVFFMSIDVVYEDVVIDFVIVS